MRLVDTLTGEVHEDGCPDCVELRAEMDAVLRKLTSAWAEIKRLERNVAEEHERHTDRPLVERLHGEWQRECRHPRAELDMGRDSRFEAYLRGLGMAKRVAKKLGLKATPADLCLVAIAGAGFDPYTQQLRNGSVERYDDPTTIFKNAASMGRFVNRAPHDVRDRLLGIGAAA